ncbi:MAG: hypothetical protein IT349_19160 [Candidatus Eisenbacteria bacterium]|nr:hypothetical protein [Candidatus Eisenbacteria bacterium]
MPFGGQSGRLGRAAATMMTVWGAVLLLLVGSGSSAAGEEASFPPDAFIDAARAASEGNPRAAADGYLELLRANPEEGRYAERYIRTSVKARDLVGAERSLRALVASRPEALVPLGALADVLDKQKKPEEAHRLFRQAMIRGVRHPQVYESALRLARQRERLEDFRVLVDSLRTARPEDPQIWYARGMLAWHLSDLDAAEEMFHQAIARDPYLFDAYTSAAAVEHQNQNTSAGYETWRVALSKAVEIGDRLRQLDLLETLGDAHWNGADVGATPYYREAITLAEHLGESERADRMRVELFGVEQMAGRLDGMAYWASEDARISLARGDTLAAGQRLAWAAGTLEICGEGQMALGLFDESLRLTERTPRAAYRVSALARRARLALVTGDIDGAIRGAQDAEAYAEGLRAIQPVAKVEHQRARVIEAHARLLRGDEPAARELYHGVVAEEIPSASAAPWVEAAWALARLEREDGRLAEARRLLDSALAARGAARDSTLTGVLALEELALFAAEGQSARVVEQGNALLRRTERMQPRGLRAATAVEVARVLLPSEPDLALRALLDGWLSAELEVPRAQVPSIPEAMLPDPEAPLEQLAVLFAQLALNPASAPSWRWVQPEDTSHAPRSAEGLLSARWSFFFTERRAHRVMEQTLSVGEKALLPRDGAALRRVLWERASNEAAAAYRALRTGSLPKGAPEEESPLLELEAEARQLLNNNPEYARLPWLIAPPDVAALRRALRPSGESLVKAAVCQDVTLLYLIQPDRFRLIATPVPRDSIAAQVRRWVPYYRNGCDTQDLSDLRDDFAVAGQLWNGLLAPIGESADPAKALWVSADGPLWYLPFESLAPRGGRAEGKDDSAIWDRVVGLPLAVDRHQIGYLPDPGVLAPLVVEPAAKSGDEMQARLILPTDDPEAKAPPQTTHCRARDGHELVQREWRRAPCEPDEATVHRVLADTDGIALTLHLSESEISETAASRSTVFFCPTFYRTNEPSASGFAMGGTITPDSDNFLRSWEWGRLPLGEFCALPEASACALDPAPVALAPARWGLELVTPALVADFAGCRAVYQSLWNADEAAWIPLVSLLAHDLGPSFELFDRERRRLRDLSLPAGSGHRLALAHPFFSCSVRWWRLAPS